MAIEKNNYKAARFESEFSPGSRDTLSSDDEELQLRGSAVGSDDEDDDEFDDADSGAGSDDFDLLELGETHSEFCQVGNSTCSVPFELYDLPGLEDILSVDVWNECLSEEERFSLSRYLPDMDQQTFVHTLKELFDGGNFHFGSPVKELFEMLKGGLCEPRVALYREGLKFFQQRQHYHLLRKHQNSVVNSLCQIRDTWRNCRGYSIEERLRVLNIMRSQKNLMSEKREDAQLESSEGEEFDDAFHRRRVKAKKSIKKMGVSGYGIDSNLEYIPQGQLVALERAKQNRKGIPKTGASKVPLDKKIVGRFAPSYPELDINYDYYGSASTIHRQKYDLGETFGSRDSMELDDEDDEEPVSVTGLRQDPNIARGSRMDKSGIFRVSRNYDILRGEESGMDGFMRLPPSLKNDSQAHGRSRNANQLLDEKFIDAKPLNKRTSKYPGNIQEVTAGKQVKTLKGQASAFLSKGSQLDLLNSELFWHDKAQGEISSMDPLFPPDNLNVRSKKWKSGRESPNLVFNSYKDSLPQIGDRSLIQDYKMKPSYDNIRGSYVQNGGPLPSVSKGGRIYQKNDDTESDSSEQFDGDDDDEDDKPLARGKLQYPTNLIKGSQSYFVNSGLDSKTVKSSKNNTREEVRALDGIAYLSRKMGRFGENVSVAREEYYPKTKQKNKMHESNPFTGYRFMGNGPHSKLGQFLDDDRIPVLSKNGLLRGEQGDRLHMSSVKALRTEKRQKGEAYDHLMLQSGYGHDYFVEDRDDSAERQIVADDNSRGRKKIHGMGSYDRREKSGASLLGCNLLSKKRKGRDYVADIDGRDEDHERLSALRLQTDDSPPAKKRGKRRVEADAVTLDMEALEPLQTEIRATEVEVEPKPQKKTFTLITPTVHTGFSFSIIHLLSAVRMAMITPLPDDTLGIGKSGEEQNGKQEVGVSGALSCDNVSAGDSNQAFQLNTPSLTVQEIVNRVKLNPRDPAILETQEPLQDLVRGVLKIFGSKTAPLGAKGWKPLIAYEKSNKSWNWIGPLSHNSNDHETMEEVTSPEAWGLPHKMLVKLVDSFANWLKNGQETLQQIGSLPAPPLELMQVGLDEKERFRDLRAQKSLNTISASSEEVRAYFRKEELLRYSIPDRAFSYTAADGKKSIVAPLRRCGGKPTSKARDHFMLKRDRPPHVTILCLVRDAAARLPGSIGTRADVCTLIRDSQYIVEDVSDAQVNQVVSGALDRLHYERDPCVQFDGERKLWVYLHREREEEDFEDDGTSSTKKWKRQKKDTAEQSEQGAVTVAFHGTGDQSGFDLGSDLNIEPPSADEDKSMKMVDNDVRQNMDENETSHGSEQGNEHHNHPSSWDQLDPNPLQGDGLICQENSTNEDFDDEGFGRERPIGLLSSSLL